MGSTAGRITRVRQNGDLLPIAALEATNDSSFARGGPFCLAFQGVCQLGTPFPRRTTRRGVLRGKSDYRQFWLFVMVSAWCVARRRRAGAYRSLLERLVGPVSARVHSKYRVVDAAYVVWQGEFGTVPQMSIRACPIDLEHGAVGIVHHLTFDCVRRTMGL